MRSLRLVKVLCVTRTRCADEEESGKVVKTVEDNIMLLLHRLLHLCYARLYLAYPAVRNCLCSLVKMFGGRGISRMPTPQHCKPANVLVL